MPNPPRKKKSPQSSSASETTTSAVRLQRILASAGFGSRRKCEELITDGRVDIDGQTVTELGTRVNPQTAKVRVDGVTIKQAKLVYFALNKPVGIVTTNRDPQGRPRVIDLINEHQRVFPVGRLDRNSEGLILMTNDGDLSEMLAHPRHGVRKSYQVTVAGLVSPETLKQMREGVHFHEGRFQVEGVSIRRTRGKATELDIVLREGKNREIRRILARLGHKVVQLKRTAIGSLKLGDLPTGAYRPLNSREVKKLRDEIAAMQATEAAEPKPARKSAPRKSSVSRSAGPSGNSPTRKTVAGKPTGPRGGSGKSSGGSKSGTPARKGSPAKPAGRRPAASDIIISSEATGSGSGTVIGAPELAAPPAKAKRPAGNRRTAKKRSPRGGAASRGKRPRR
ncbi:Ribosomal large subunit pseudouridine synthase B [Rosistilla carotiformis]|uniref:Pseudouridine synthase n=1 Tax=Rosistilla carotiformis TaxID=2528017 RepID=A0A518K170_9BACT|nr:pseudouridine synthase [Rosistilla carotiformis]QDV71495.1 Ribosomal large subunit pseudouridine synthase B [Rosistilla carotiformis]